MRTVNLVDTGVFVSAGRADDEKYTRLKLAVRTASVTLCLPRRVYRELGGDRDPAVLPTWPQSASTVGRPPDRRESRAPIDDAIDAGWVAIAPSLDYTDSTVSTVMDETRRFIASKRDTDEDRIEKADTALVGMAAQLLSGEAVDYVMLHSTDQLAGQAAISILPRHGFRTQIEFHFVRPHPDALTDLRAKDFTPSTNE